MTTATDITASPAEATVELDTPIQRGETAITCVALRKPRVGDLRGLNLTEILQMKSEAIAALLMRVSQPTLVRHEIDAMDPADFMSLAGEVVLFFASRANRAQAFLSE